MSTFKKKELLKLAKKKNLREVPENWNKEKIVDALSLFVTKSDLVELTSNALKSKTSEGRGYELREIGDKLEKKVLSLLESKGYKCEKNVRIPGSEFDIVGHKKGGILRSYEWIFVECKNKPRVVPSDFKKFLGNFELFCKKEKLERERVQAVFYTTGLFDVMVKKQASEFANIKLKRISLKY